MREHDLELIAALAGGRLEDEAEARALIASSEEARAEYAAQKLAIEALGAATPVAMSDTERAGLRRDLWTEITTSSPATGSAKPWYYRWMPVAAGMLVLIGLIAVLDRGGIDELATADQGAAATTLAASETTAAASEGSGDDSGEADEETVTESPTVSTVADSGDGDAGAAPPPATAFYSAEADAIRSGEEPEPELRAQDPSPEELADCLQQAGLEGFQIQHVDPAPEEAEGVDVDSPEEAVPYLAAIPVGADLATAEVVFVALEMCEVIHIDR